nr:metallo-beta-lactamase domain-containing protein 1-like isoform X1 [Biomphalaria glabrata]
MGPSLLYRPQTSSSASLAVQTLPSTSCDVSPLASPLHDALPISPTSHDVLTLDSASHSPAITHDVSPFASFSNDILHLPSTSHDNPPLPSGSCFSTLPATSPDSPLPSTSYGKGYTQLDSQGTVRSCSTVTLLKGPHRNIIVNTGNPSERDLLLKALSDQGLKPEDIHYVICLNGHIEQIGNLNLFSGAVHCVGYDICQHDQYLLHELKEGMPFNIDEDVEIGPTPGHTGNDVSVVVKKANLGVLAGVGDLFYCEGHGPTFKVPQGYKSQRILDEHEEHISSPQMTTSTSELDAKLYWTKGTAEIDEGNRGDGNEVELEEQKITKENLRKRMREVKKLDITADNLVKSLESSLKEKEHEVKQEQQRNRELDAKFKNLLQEKESIEAQLQKILDNHYTEKSELSSKIKSLQEEKKTTQRSKRALKKKLFEGKERFKEKIESSFKKNNSKACWSGLKQITGYVPKRKPMCVADNNKFFQ